MTTDLICSGKGGCNRTLPTSAFYPEKRSRRGYRTLCKQCHIAKSMARPRPQPSADVKKRSLKKHAEKRADWEKEYNQRPERREWRKNYLAANKHKTSHYKATRRMREGLRMTEEDREISKAYRKAIENDPCFYCGVESEHTDHKFPLSKGGTDHWWNLCRACSHCNETKLARCITKFLLLTTDVCEMPK